MVGGCWAASVGVGSAVLVAMGSRWSISIRGPRPSAPASALGGCGESGRAHQQSGRRIPRVASSDRPQHFAPGGALGATTCVAHAYDSADGRAAGTRPGDAPMRMMLALPGIALVYGCAAATAQPSSTAPTPRLEPDCSFRSASTCWTVAGRFPSWLPESAVPKPDDIRDPSPITVANRADSARGSQ